VNDSDVKLRPGQAWSGELNVASHSTHSDDPHRCTRHELSFDAMHRLDPLPFLPFPFQSFLLAFRFLSFPCATKVR